MLRFAGPRLRRGQVRDFSHCLQVGASSWLGPSGGLDDLVNHSCEPNCGLTRHARRIELTSLRPLMAGEEVTFDYSTSMAGEPWSLECGCGAPSCRRVVGDFWDAPPSVRERYLALGVVLPHVLRAAPPDTVGPRASVRVGRPARLGSPRLAAS
jgi:hypothetical protein